MFKRSETCLGAKVNEAPNKNIDNKDEALWDDTDCTVDDELNTTASVMSPKVSLKFNNTLLHNKGNIHTAKKLVSKDEMEFLQLMKENSLDSFSVSDSESSGDSVSLDSNEGLDIRVLEVVKLTKEKYAQRQVSCRENRKWESL